MQFGLDIEKMVAIAFDGLEIKFDSYLAHLLHNQQP